MGARLRYETSSLCSTDLASSGTMSKQWTKSSAWSRKRLLRMIGFFLELREKLLFGSRRNKNTKIYFVMILSFNRHIVFFPQIRLYYKICDSRNHECKIYKICTVKIN